MAILKKPLFFLLRFFGIRRKGDLIILWYFKNHIFFTIKMLRASQSQISQDVFVSCHLKLWKKESNLRYFVEFGATDGVYLSNTLILEKIFKWNGLLVEPASIWAEKLTINRKSKIDFRCVYNVTGEKIEFNESEDAVYSTIDKFSKSDTHTEKRTYGSRYLVDTVTLNDLLTDHDAPEVIDYLSIDTEGSEYLVLQAVDFSKWKFKIITVEHNYTPQRALIKELLYQNGYVRVFENISLMDDWYVQI